MAPGPSSCCPKWALPSVLPSSLTGTRPGDLLQVRPFWDEVGSATAGCRAGRAEPLGLLTTLTNRRCAVPPPVAPRWRVLADADPRPFRARWHLDSKQTSHILPHYGNKRKWKGSNGATHVVSISHFGGVLRGPSKIPVLYCVWSSFCRVRLRANGTAQA